MSVSNPIVPIELDELEDAVINTLLVVERTLEANDAELTDGAITAATTVAKLLPGDHPLRGRVIGCLGALRSGQARSSLDTASNDLLDLVSDLNDLNEARLPD